MILPELLVWSFKKGIVLIAAWISDFPSLSKIVHDQRLKHLRCRFRGLFRWKDEGYDLAIFAEREGDIRLGQPGFRSGCDWPDKRSCVIWS